MSMNVVEASGLGKRYGRTWALRECTLAVPAGHVAALVGPNGAGKTTLLNLAVALAAPTAGTVTVLGGRAPGSPAALDGIAFVAQDTPLYKNLPAADMLHLTANLNRRFDQAYAKARLAELGIPLNRKAGKLSGGQQAQLALTLALARRPRLLVLDEPVAMLDPVARHDFMATVLIAAADDGVSVLLSSHVLAELERVADYLILLSRGRVQVAGQVDDLLACHRVLTGPAAEADRYTERPVVHARRGEAQAHLLVRAARTIRSRRAGRRTRSAWRNSPWPTCASPAPRAARPGPRPAAATRTVAGDAMTTLTVPARPGRRQPAAGAVAADGLGHLAAAPVALAGVAVFLGVLAVWLWLPAFRCTTPTRPPATRQAHCLPATSAADGMDGFLANGFILQAVPALIGAFVGAPVLAREMETGTFRFAWTQGFGRWRWTLAKLVLLAVTVAAAAGMFSLLLSWYYQPYFNTGNQALNLSEVSPFFPGLFDLRGVAFAAWTLAAFAIGALAGMLIRRVVPAIAATLAAYAGLALAAGLYLRQHYLTPLVASNLNLPGSAWVISQWWTKGGQPVSQSVLGQVLQGGTAAGREGRGSEVPRRDAVPHPARVHAVDELPAGQPVLAIPVDRGWLAARAVSAAHRRHRLAGPPPGRLTASGESESKRVGSAGW